MPSVELQSPYPPTSSNSQRKICCARWQNWCLLEIHPSTSTFHDGENDNQSGWIHCTMGRAIGKLVDIRLAKFFTGRACQRFLNILDWGRRPDKARPVGANFNRSGITWTIQPCDSFTIHSDIQAPYYALIYLGFLWNIWNRD
jgi:hypothetical protein